MGKCIWQLWCIMNSHTHRLIVYYENTGSLVLAGSYHWSLCWYFEWWQAAQCLCLCEFALRNCIAVSVIFLCPLFDKDAGNGLFWLVDMCCTKPACKTLLVNWRHFILSAFVWIILGARIITVKLIFQHTPKLKIVYVQMWQMWRPHSCIFFSHWKHSQRCIEFMYVVRCYTAMPKEGMCSVIVG
jgi:hypothetical protein